MTDNIIIRALLPHEQLPYELLLMADPSQKLVDAYLYNAKVLVADIDMELVGVCVLQFQSTSLAEIKNIAVALGWQGNGIATLLLNEIIALAKNLGLKKLAIGTANSSVGQLHLYQKVGFEMDYIKKNFFLENYPEPIVENGIVCKHMLMLSMNL